VAESGIFEQIAREISPVTAVDDPDIWPTTAGTILPENWQKT
jgi:hypothetical protein